jgi:REP-associated tyrosine transposase
MPRTFFATTKTSMGRPLLQSERNAGLMIDVLRSLVSEQAFALHDFVIMPDHVHLLITVKGSMAIEKVMQLIKGRFSFRLGREFGHLGEVWQRGFSEVRVLGKESLRKYTDYIAQNPVKAGLIAQGGSFPFCYRTLAERKLAGKQNVSGATEQGLKPKVF